MQLRLFVFHHAGGSHLMYRDWPALFPAGWRVRLPDAPGRGLLSPDEPIEDAIALARHFLAELDDELTGDFAFFGHSMGCVTAYELTQLLLAEGRTPPVWLGLSGRAAPRADGTGRTFRHLLPDADLLRHVAALGGTPPAVLDEPELWELLAPAIRGDLRLAETWDPQWPPAPLPVPLSVFGGRDDEVAPPWTLAAWPQATEHFLGTHLFDGGHFYFLDDPAPLTALITREAVRAQHTRTTSGTGATGR
ncbi:alpha/beta fold hydrolase [Streptomyces sp. 15-116A]|uniref:thioesterase II family protein n=1 Tax=Streptomyces sp. 15-116A TaxID=2259035 RepID=UPI0021B4782E|nr:alpha/beta fold hydrolase [Streptomyces sp. 15-116A]MCT7356977.1 alpha/beta fold hydrolase [Streptomyces sp. 15-116A]